MEILERFYVKFLYKDFYIKIWLHYANVFEAI